MRERRIKLRREQLCSQQFEAWAAGPNPPSIQDLDQVAASLGNNAELLKLASYFTSNARPLEFGYLEIFQ